MGIKVKEVIPESVFAFLGAGEDFDKDADVEVGRYGKDGFDVAAVPVGMRLYRLEKYS